MNEWTMNKRMNESIGDPKHLSFTHTHVLFSFVPWKPLSLPRAMLKAGSIQQNPEAAMRVCSSVKSWWGWDRAWDSISFFPEFPTHRTVLSTLLASLPFCPSESGMLQGQVCIFCTEAREDMVKAYAFSQQTSTCDVWVPRTMPGSQDPEVNETQLLTSGGSQSSRDLATKQQQFWPLWASWSGMSPWYVRYLVTDGSIKPRDNQRLVLGSLLFWFPPGALCPPPDDAAACPSRAPWAALPRLSVHPLCGKLVTKSACFPKDNWSIAKYLCLPRAFFHCFHQQKFQAPTTF